MDDEPLRVALRVQQQAAELGFDWPDVAAVWGKLDEEWRELAEARCRACRRPTRALRCASPPSRPPPAPFRPWAIPAGWRPWRPAGSRPSVT